MVFALAAAAFVAGVPRTAGAGDAAELIKEGIALRRKGDDAGALEKFQQAHRLQESPRALAQMALAEQALGRWAAAHDHLVAALDGGGDAWIAKNRATLTESLRSVEQHVGKLDVLGQPAGAEIRVDGVLRGTLPLAAPLTVTTGTVRVDLTAPGHHDAQRTTIVRAGQMTRESFDPLTALPTVVPLPQGIATGAAANGEPAAGGVLGRPGDPQGTLEAPARDDGPSALRLSAKWIAGGVALAALTGGTVAYLLHDSAADTFNKECWIDWSGAPAPKSGSTWTNDRCRNQNNKVDTGYRLSVVGFAAGAALATTAVVLWLTEPKPASRRETAFRCTPLPTPTTVAIDCHLRF